MANPSIVNATAIGKEVLRRTYITGAGESLQTILTVPAEHIITILSISIMERSNEAASKFDLLISPDGGTAFYLLIQQGVPGYDTFVWSDRIVLTGGDLLKIEPAGTGTVTFDVWCSYIDQQFAAP